MKRTGILVAVLVVVGMIAIPAVGAVAQQTETETQEDSVTPGERLSGVVGVQGAEIDGEVERNAYAIALERADDNATKASHIAEKLNETEQRLAELDERKAELREQRDNGNITEGQYRARTAKLATEVDTAKEQLNQSNATAAELPAETLEENGVNATAIRTLMDSANELSGGEVSEIARSIAGDRSGMPDRAADRNGGDDRDGDRGAGDNRAGNNTAADDLDSETEGDGEQTADDEETDDEKTDGSESQTGSGSDSDENDGDDSDNAGSP